MADGAVGVADVLARVVDVADALAGGVVVEVEAADGLAEGVEVVAEQAGQADEVAGGADVPWRWRWWPRWGGAGSLPVSRYSGTTLLALVAAMKPLQGMPILWARRPAARLP